jgi:hypothetical protein
MSFFKRKTVDHQKENSHAGNPADAVVGGHGGSHAGLGGAVGPPGGHFVVSRGKGAMSPPNG